MKIYIASRLLNQSVDHNVTNAIEEMGSKDQTENVTNSIIKYKWF